MCGDEDSGQTRPAGEPLVDPDPEPVHGPEDEPAASSRDGGQLAECDADLPREDETATDKHFEPL